MNIRLWYENGLSKYLSELGYVHFGVKLPLVKLPLEVDCSIQGSAFFINTDNKTFGNLDRIYNGDIKEAYELSREFKETGRLRCLEMKE